METTNEELQSTVEELETTNEELQSTNEEMETMNEELQSTNEALQAINDELRRRSEELRSLNDGVVVVDRGLNVLAWNHKAEDLWGLRTDEVRGKNFLNPDIGLPVAQVKHAMWDCLSEKTEYAKVALEATNRRGKTIQVEVSCTPLRGPDHTMQGVILMIQEKRPEGESA